MGLGYRSSLEKLQHPPLQIDSCNSTSNFAGSLPDDTICLDRQLAASQNDTNCNVSATQSLFINIFFFENGNNCKLSPNCQQNEIGSSLMCYSARTSSWQTKGLLSFRNDCHRHALPAVYTQFTPTLLNWIAKTIGNGKMIQR